MFGLLEQPNQEDNLYKSSNPEELAETKQLMDLIIKWVDAPKEGVSDRYKDTVKMFKECLQVSDETVLKMKKGDPNKEVPNFIVPIGRLREAMGVSIFNWYTCARDLIKHLNEDHGYDFALEVDKTA